MNSTEIRKLITLIEEKMDLKKEVINAIQTTTDDELLQKILTALQSGNIDKKVAEVLSQNTDAKQFMNQIANTVLEVVAPIEVKEEFLDKYNKGIINPKTLLDGNEHSFLELCQGDYFATEVFKILCTKLTSQGVGPGEVALAVMSPDISWSGRAVGGGDIQVGNKAVEVKTSVSSGGRWINPRKARMDMIGIERAINDGLAFVAKKSGTPAESLPKLPDRLNPSYWVNELRPVLAQDPKILKEVTKTMANGLFNQTNNSAYQNALISGTPEEIKNALLEVGFNNYKAYSKFDGILMMDVNSESSQYFPTYESMAGKIKVDSVYLYSPEGEAMPKVRLTSTSGPDIGAKPGAKAPKTAAPAPEKTIKPVTGLSARAGGVEAPQKGVSAPRARR
jgi:hypothetical protein